MPAIIPGLTADQVLRTFKSEALTLFLGAAVVATGLVAAAFAAIRRRRVALLIYFAVFALLYGARMCMQTAMFYFISDASPAFVRIREAMNFVVPIPAFLFFDGAGFLRRNARILAYSFFVVFAILAVATLVTGPSNLYQQTNNLIVIAALVLLLTEPMRGLSPSHDFVVARRGLLTFAAFALWDNLSGVFHSRFPRIEPLGFVVLLACLGYVAAWQALKRDEQLAEIQAHQAHQVDALEQAVKLSSERYVAGKASYYEVLEAQQQLFPAELSLARTERDQLLAIVALYKGLGGGWQDNGPILGIQ